MSKEEIDDLSKADVFAKLFACVQSVWLVVQSIARVSVGLPITQLELATIALVFCALIMYALWWNKPFGVEHTVAIYALHDGNISATIAAIKEASKPQIPVITDERKLLESYFTWRLQAAVLEDSSPPPNLTFQNFLTMALSSLEDAGMKDVVKFGKTLGRMMRTIFRKSLRNSIYLNRNLAVCITFFAAGTLFSAFHIGAWNWEFPTSTSRTIWRSFALTATGAGPLTVVMGIIGVAITDKFHYGSPLHDISINVTRGALGLLAVAYFLARLGLIVLIFYCFFSMPAAVYETVNWAQFLPHFT
jgi:hypothetical protein